MNDRSRDRSTRDAAECAGLVATVGDDPLSPLPIRPARPDRAALPRVWLSLRLAGPARPRETGASVLVRIAPSAQRAELSAHVDRPIPPAPILAQDPAGTSGQRATAA